MPVRDYKDIRPRAAVNLPSVQQTPKATHRPSPDGPQGVPLISHGVRTSFSMAQVAASIVFMKHPIDVPQQILGPIHCPIPLGPQRMH